MLISSPNDGWKITYKKWEADYVLVYVAGQRVDGNWNGNSLYVLNGGGDESKKSWFMRIAVMLNFQNI